MGIPFGIPVIVAGVWDTVTGGDPHGSDVQSDGLGCVQLRKEVA